MEKSETPLLFPLDSLPEKIQDIVQQVHTELNFPKNYTAAALLFATSVAIGNSRVLYARSDWKVKSILFMALIGEPGALKSHPINFALKPLEKSDTVTLSQYERELEEYRRSQNPDRREKPRAQQFIVRDFTFESISRVLKSNPIGICVHADELKGWIESFNKYRNSGGDLEQWLTLFNGSPIVVNRKSQDDIICISNPFVSVIGSMQPGILAKVFRGDRKEDGFLPRILFVNNSSYNQPMLWKDEDLPITAPSDWERILLHIIEKSRPYNGSLSAVEYNLHKLAWGELKEWQNDKERELTGKGSNSDIEIFRKIQDYALRFCIPIHTLREITNEIEESLIIDPYTALKATHIAEYFFATAREAYAHIESGGFPDAGIFHNFMASLPTIFSTQQALSMGAAMGLSRRTIFRYLDTDRFYPFLSKLKQGMYEKKL